MSRRSQSFALHAVLIAGGLLTLFPLLWMLSASFMSNGESTTFPPHLVPHAATLAQYRALFLRLNIGRAFLSSTIVAVTVTLSSVLFGSMAGYAFAKLRFRGRERSFGLLLTAVQVIIGAIVYIAALAFLDPRRRSDLRRLMRRLRRLTGPATPDRPSAGRRTPR